MSDSVPTLRTINEAWQSYRRDVVTEKAGVTQLVETRRAFYAGFWAALTAMTHGTRDLSDEAGMAVLEGYHDEALIFAKRVMQNMDVMDFVPPGAETPKP